MKDGAIILIVMLVIVLIFIPSMRRTEAHLADHHGGLYIIHNGESVAIGSPPSPTENTQP